MTVVYLAIILSLVGLIVLIGANGWKVCVQDNVMTINKMIFLQQSFCIEDIEKAQVGSKKEIKIYVSGKAVTTIDCMCNNYRKLYRTLEEHHIPVFQD